jgi:hypothetical protein
MINFEMGVTIPKGDLLTGKIYAVAIKFNLNRTSPYSVGTLLYRRELRNHSNSCLGESQVKLLLF